MHRWTLSGRCPCGGHYEDRFVEVRIAPAAGGEPITLESVAQGACPMCGARVYHASTLQRIEAVMAQALRPDAH